MAQAFKLSPQTSLFYPIVPFYTLILQLLLLKGFDFYYSISPQKVVNKIPFKHMLKEELMQADLIYAKIRLISRSFSRDIITLCVRLLSITK